MSPNVESVPTPMRKGQLRAKAVRMLALCTAFWALSFPAMKALSLTQQQLLPGIDTWFVTSVSVAYRFAIAALCLLPFILLSKPRLTRCEFVQGALIGGIGGVGILLQMDGLSYTHASTSAFLTQLSCVLLPCWIAIKHRSLPSKRVMICCVIVMVGVAILSGVTWQSLKLGRGELETLIAATIFTAQILWLEHPGFARNRTLQFSMVMFLMMSLTSVPVALATAPSAGAWIDLYQHRGSVAALAVLVFLSALGGYLLMNHWQKHVPATHAGLIYCLEPVFASLFALFLPSLFTRFAGVHYDNEQIGWQLLAGGSLITVANVLLQLGEKPTTPSGPV